MMTSNIISMGVATFPAANFSEMSIGDIASAIDALIVMRMTVNNTSCLANHMDREALEDFADRIVIGIDAQLEAIEEALLGRPDPEPAEVADIEDQVLRIKFALRPQERGMNLRMLKEAANG